MGSNPTPSVSAGELRDWDSDGVEPEAVAAPAARRPIPLPPRALSEPTRPDPIGGVVLTGKAPHSKCGVRKHLGVRVPPPPLRSPWMTLDRTLDGRERRPRRGRSALRRAGGHSSNNGAWLSPVERCVRVAEVPGSNPGAPIGGRSKLRPCQNDG